MEKNRTLVSVLLVCLAGCQGSSSDTKNQATQPSGETNGALTTPAIGSPCEASDGWQPEPLIAGDDEDAVNVPREHMDAVHLDPGVGYCLIGSAQYPHGYFTMNCRMDDDCPDASMCEDAPHTNGDYGLCRAPCENDSECDEPTSCVGSDKLKFCSCPDCVVTRQ